MITNLIKISFLFPSGAEPLQIAVGSVGKPEPAYEKQITYFVPKQKKTKDPLLEKETLKQLKKRLGLELLEDEDAIRWIEKMHGNGR